MTANDPHSAALALVRRHGTRDPFRLARELGCIVIRTPLQGIRGFYQYLHRQRILYVDSALPEAEARLVCAHELGHALLHRGCNRIYLDANTYFPASRQEVEASRFALSLLYDDDSLRLFLEHPVQLAAEHMGVSTDLARYRLSRIPPAENM